MKDVFSDLYELNRAIPIGPIRSLDGREVGYMFQVRITCRDGKDAIRTKEHEKKIEADQRRLRRLNVKKRRCDVRIKRRDELRVAWSCSKYVARFSALSPREAKGMFPTLRTAADAVSRDGLQFTPIRAAQ